MGRGSGKGQAAIATRGVLPLAQVPTVELEEVFHVGTLRAEDKGVAHSSSWEGHGLSFSLDPAAWERIARLGGAPWWSLRRRGGRFLDYWRLDDEQKARISAWAVDQGLALWEDVWRVSHYDDELDDVVSILCEDEDEARMEAEDREGAEVKRARVLAPTAELERRLGMRSQLDCFDHVLVLWADAERPDLDGVWWEDEYGPYSAPRGVILPSRVGAWQPERIERFDGAHE